MLIRKSTFLPVILAGVFALAVASRYQAGEAPAKGKQAFRWPEGKRGAISLSFDDARPSQVDNGVPLLDRYHVHATFFVQPDGVKQRLEAWKRAVAAGHEMGNHTLVHPCSGNFPWARQKALENYTLDKMRAELTEANRQVKALLGVTPVTFAYPCGETFVGRGTGLKSFVPLVAQMFKASRLWLGESPNDPAFCDMAQVLSVPTDDIEFSQLKPTIEQAMQNGQWLVLAGHDTAATGQRQVTRLKTLEAICQYANDPKNGIWIDTVDKVASYIVAHRAEVKAQVIRRGGGTKGQRGVFVGALLLRPTA